MYMVGATGTSASFFLLLLLFFFSRQFKLNSQIKRIENDGVTMHALVWSSAYPSYRILNQILQGFVHKNSYQISSATEYLLSLIYVFEFIQSI